MNYIMLLLQTHNIVMFICYTFFLYNMHHHDICTMSPCATLHKELLDPSSQVSDIPLTGRQKVKADHLSMPRGSLICQWE